MTRFGAIFGATAGRVLRHNNGQSVEVTEPGRDAESVTAILGKASTRVKPTQHGDVLVRNITASFVTSECCPSEGWTVTVAGEVWSVTGIESYTESMVCVMLEREEIKEISKRGYRA